MLRVINNSSRVFSENKNLSHFYKTTVQTRGSIAISSLRPPIAKKVDHIVKFGFIQGEYRGKNLINPPKEINDPYFWLRDDNRKEKEVIDYLNAENKYTEQLTSHLSDFNNQLYEEMKGYLKETDSSYPYNWGPYLWYKKTVEGLSYPIHCRQKKGEIEEEIILDENKVAEGLKYCSIGNVVTSPISFDLVAFSIDLNGYETYSVIIKKISTNEVIETIENTDGTICWDNTEKYIYYVKQNKFHRPFQVYKHKLGTNTVEDTCIFEENDEKFNVDIKKTRSGRFLIITTLSKETSEIHLIDLEKEPNSLICVQSKIENRLYSIDHHNDHLFIVTNNPKENFRLMKAPISNPSYENWQEVPNFKYDPNRNIDYCSCFDNYIAISGREDGTTQIWVGKLNNNSELTEIHRISFDEAVYTIKLSINKQYQTDLLRISYTSLTTPTTIIDYNVLNKKKQILKVQEVPEYDKNEYESNRIYVNANDGRRIPVSIVYHKKLFYSKNGPKPLLLYGYGSYGISIDPSFDLKRLPLLNRGMVFAIAHVRGGGEMGQYWYESEGKYLQKKNTFTDFISVAEHLIKQNMTSPNLLAIEGRSAGGLLLGAVLNMRPDLFQIALSGVPFVDVMVTMCDPSIPLTVVEWEEWGNPNEEKFFDYMFSYSPINNVKAQNYPNILITAGLNDPRVAYWEPAKWVAHLREKKTDKNKLLLKVDMSSGHFSASDRYKYLRERSFEYGVLLDCLNLKCPPKHKSSL
eukprot:c21638_g1_i1.p1 GENE.c21638_g1_i1~~c21638_g1_i1.p1  ORF type:complete len:758 (-),score=243.03 c21638_g1_i1:40-2280(-)